MRPRRHPTTAARSLSCRNPSVGVSLPFRHFVVEASRPVPMDSIHAVTEASLFLSPSHSSVSSDPHDSSSRPATKMHPALLSHVWSTCNREDQRSVPQHPHTCLSHSCGHAATIGTQSMRTWCPRVRVHNEPHFCMAKTAEVHAAGL